MRYYGWSKSICGLLIAGAANSACLLRHDDSDDDVDCNLQVPFAEVCSIGYSCLAGKCVAHGSVGIGETCSDDTQCSNDGSVVCGTEPSTCRVACWTYYHAANCAGGQFCRPEQSRGDYWVGTCITSECTTNESCRSSSEPVRQCVGITPQAKACLATCEVSVTPVMGAAPDITDTCGSATDTQKYCQPIGPTAAPSLVCFDRLDADDHFAPDVSEPCELVEDPCKRGLACHASAVVAGGSCRRYCDPRQTEVDSNTNPACVTNEGAQLTPTHSCCKILDPSDPNYDKIGLCLPGGC